LAHDRQALQESRAATLRSTSLSVLAVICIVYGVVVIAITALQWVLVEILTSSASNLTGSFVLLDNARKTVS
jgi:hypothetical protein